MSKIVKEFMHGKIKVLTGEDAHEFATQVQTYNRHAPIGNTVLHAATTDQHLISGGVTESE